MADDTQNPGDGRQEATRHSPTPKDVNGSRAKTFTQEEVDHIVNERLSRERSGKSDYEALKSRAGDADELQSKLDKALQENERLRSEAEKAEHEKELSAIRAGVASRYGITDPSVLVGDDEKQIGEYAEKLMKMFADMRSRGTVAEQSARTGQARARRSSRDDFADAMRNTLP
ncbi:scaffolding protein [Bifidobacterium dentium]|uniref:scaffolding protein n=1 Tax=Bifidobacterium dentium TaxID=1689 RepID=UPI0018C1D2F6|nr:scaffolding protein [Bifidobacterium dentium]MBF9708011.1 scaffolding protein [Bifidobacterium dentium]